MDEFINSVLREKTKTLDVEHFIKTYNKFPVLASEDYIVNELVRTQKDIILINPKSSIGQFLKDHIPYVNELIKVEPLKQEQLFLYEIPKQVEQPEFERLKSLEITTEGELVETTPVSATDDYREQHLPSNVIPMYQHRSFNPNQSWYEQMPLRGLETKMQYYTPRRRAPTRNPVYEQPQRDAFNPYACQKKPENLFNVLYKRTG